MKKTYFISTLLILAIAFSCSSDKSESKKSETPRVSNEAEQVVFNFYKWYLKDIYLSETSDSPDLKITEDSIHQIDNTKFLKFLNESGYFSKEYYDSKIAKYNACDEVLKQKGKELDFPQDAGKNGECDFLGYQIWTGGQGEVLNTVDIVSSTVNKDSAIVIAVIGDSIGNYLYSYPTITLLNENGKWKIRDVEVSYKAP